MISVLMRFLCSCLCAWFMLCGLMCWCCCCFRYCCVMFCCVVGVDVVVVCLMCSVGEFHFAGPYSSQIPQLIAKYGYTFTLVTSTYNITQHISTNIPHTTYMHKINFGNAK